MRRLAQSIVDFDLTSSSAQAKLDDLKNAARVALDRERLPSGHYMKVHGEEMRQEAVAHRRKETEERNQALLQEIATIRAAAAPKRLTWDEVADALNRRGQVFPVKAVEWSALVLRLILHRKKRTEGA